jgi:hypothetical protein
MNVENTKIFGAHDHPAVFDPHLRPNIAVCGIMDGDLNLLQCIRWEGVTTIDNPILEQM